MDAGDMGKSRNRPKARGFGQQAKTHAVDGRRQLLGPRWEGHLPSCNPLLRYNITCVPTKYSGNMAVEGCFDVMGWRVGEPTSINIM